MSQPAADSAPAIRGRDVLHVLLATAGLTVGLAVTAIFAYSVLIVFGFSGTSILSVPVLFALESVAVLGGIYHGLIRRRGMTWQQLGWLRVPWVWLALGGLASVSLYVVLLTVQVLVARMRGVPPVDVLPAAAAMFPRGAVAFIASLLFGAVTVPVAEEFLFRGILYRWLRGRWGVLAGALISASLFAVIHPPSAGAAPVIFLIGLVLAYFYERTGSLQPGMVLHGVNNAIGIIWIYLTFWLGV